MAAIRELKGRINSVHSSQKITGAMKMISSARLRKSESKLLQSQPYVENLWRIYDHIVTSGCDYESPLASVREIRRVALIIFASDDGLCGAFNINLYKNLLSVVAAYKAKGVAEIVVYPVGKKIAHDILRIQGIRVEEILVDFKQKDSSHATQQLADSLMDCFLKNDTDRVDIIYSHYKSIGVQIVQEQQFLPVQAKIPEAGMEKESWYIYEPDCESILKVLYPLILHALMYKTFVENQTSEQAARIMAMQLANDNANKLLGNLQLEYNKLRQQGITSELLDIAGGTVR